MMFQQREHGYRRASLDEVVGALADLQFTLCTAFLIPGKDGWMYLLANDATSEDGLQEYSVRRVLADDPETHTMQVEDMESITVDWVLYPPQRAPSAGPALEHLDRLWRLIAQATSAEARVWSSEPFTISVCPVDQHTCHHCR
jgi:hypothetical protein